MKFIDKLSARERMFFYLTLTVVGLFLAYRFVITPMLAKISELKDQERQLKEDIESDRIYIMHEKDINIKYDKYSEYLKSPQADAEKMGNLLKIVSGLASNWNLPILNSKPNIEEKDNVKYYVVRLESEGKMSQIVNFLYELNTKKSLIYIEKIELSPIKTLGKEDILRAAIVIYEIFIQ